MDPDSDSPLTDQPQNQSRGSRRITSGTHNNLGYSRSTDPDDYNTPAYTPAYTFSHRSRRSRHEYQRAISGVALGNSEENGTSSSYLDYYGGYPSPARRPFWSPIYEHNAMYGDDSTYEHDDIYEDYADICEDYAAIYEDEDGPRGVSMPQNPSFECQWEIPKLVEELRRETTRKYLPPGDILATYVVVTGSPNNLRCTTCREYLQERWGEVGRDALRIAKLLLEHHDGSRVRGIFSLAFAEGSVSADADNLKLIFKFTETKFFVDYAEAFAWMSSAVRPSSRDTGNKVLISQVPRVVPSTRYLKLTPLQPARDELAFKCWTSLFSSGVVALFRSGETKREWGEGIEIPFGLMVQLAAVQNYHCVNGGAILLGFRTALVPTKMSEEFESIQWHLEVTEKLLPSQLPSVQDDWFRTMDTSKFEKTRCFLGWSEKANVMLGTSALLSDAANQIEFTMDLNTRDREQLSWSGVEAGVQGSFSMGAIGGQIQATSVYTLQSRIQRFTPPRDFLSSLLNNQDKVALVVDSEAKRAWVVPFISLVLHLCHVYVDSRKLPVNPGQLPFAKPSVDGALATIKALQDKGSQVVFGSKEKGALKTVGQLFLEVSTDLLESCITREDPENGKIYASELMDLVDQNTKGFRRREIPVSGCADSWKNLVQHVDVVGVCANIGAAIKPVGSGTPCECHELAQGRYLLAAHLSCLNRLNRKEGREIAGDHYKLGKNAYWKPKSSRSHIPKDASEPGHQHIWDDWSTLSPHAHNVCSGVKRGEKATRAKTKMPTEGVVVFANPPTTASNLFPLQAASDYAPRLLGKWYDSGLPARPRTVSSSSQDPPRSCDCTGDCYCQQVHTSAIGLSGIGI